MVRALFSLPLIENLNYHFNLLSLPFVKHMNRKDGNAVLFLCNGQIPISSRLQVVFRRAKWRSGIQSSRD